MCLHAEDLIQYKKVFAKIELEQELNEEDMKFLKKHHIEQKFNLYKQMYALKKQYNSEG